MEQDIRHKHLIQVIAKCKDDSFGLKIVDQTTSLVFYPHIDPGVSSSSHCRPFRTQGTSLSSFNLGFWPRSRAFAAEEVMNIV